MQIPCTNRGLFCFRGPWLRLKARKHRSLICVCVWRESMGHHLNWCELGPHGFLSRFESLFLLSALSNGTEIDCLAIIVFTGSDIYFLWLHLRMTVPFHVGGQLVVGATDCKRSVTAICKSQHRRLLLDQCVITFASAWVTHVYIDQKICVECANLGN